MCLKMHLTVAIKFFIEILCLKFSNSSRNFFLLNVVSDSLKLSNQVLVKVGLI